MVPYYAIKDITRPPIPLLNHTNSPVLQKLDLSSLSITAED